MSAQHFEHFLPHIGTDFLVSDLASGRQLPLRLESVDDARTTAKEGFSLFFTGTAETPLRHDTYAVIHPALGQFFIFLGPVMGSAPGGVRYQAVFSRLK